MISPIRMKIIFSRMTLLRAAVLKLFFQRCLFSDSIYPRCPAVNYITEQKKPIDNQFY
jgi:hypothetical protein